MHIFMGVLAPHDRGFSQKRAHTHSRGDGECLLLMFQSRMTHGRRQLQESFNSREQESEGVSEDGGRYDGAYAIVRAQVTGFCQRKRAALSHVRGEDRSLAPSFRR